MSAERLRELGVVCAVAPVVLVLAREARRCEER